MTRKVVQIAVTVETEECHGKLYALDNEGRIWLRVLDMNAKWRRIEALPQDDEVVVGSCIAKSSEIEEYRR